MKLTAELQERVVAALRAGNYAEAACRSAGIAASTFYRWMARGEAEPGSLFAAFREAVVRAEADAEVHAVTIIRRAMTSDWRASSWYLERRYPDRWRAHNRTEIITGGGERAGLDLSRLSDQELAQLEELTRRAAPPE